MLVKSEIAQRQIDSELAERSSESAPDSGNDGGKGGEDSYTEPGGGVTAVEAELPTAENVMRRFYGTVQLDAARVGRDASQIAEEVIAHLVGQVGAEVSVTLEIQAVLPDGASEQVVRTVTENSRTLKFTSHGFESE